METKPQIGGAAVAGWTPAKSVYEATLRLWDASGVQQEDEQRPAVSDANDRAYMEFVIATVTTIRDRLYPK